MPTSDKRGPWAVLVALAVVGVVCIVVPAAVTLPRVVHDLSLALGTAFLIAAFLGASVDRWFKQELLRDAFHAVFGHILAEELRDELTWVYEQKVLCDRFDLMLTLIPTDDPDLLTAHIALSRDLRNITTRPVKPPLLLAIDEWFHEGRPSRVISLHCTQDGETIVKSRFYPARCASSPGSWPRRCQSDPVIV
jgi:hypothetical protein